MSEQTQEYAQNQGRFVQNIVLKPGQLHRVKVTNLAGRTRIVGTDKDELVIRMVSQDGQPLQPRLDFKNEGSEVEISTNLDYIWQFGNWQGGGLPDDFDENIGDYEREARKQARNFRREAKEAARQARRAWVEFDFDNKGFDEVFQNIGREVGRFFQQANAELYLEVPANIELEAGTTSGALEVQNIKGFCKLSNTTGMLKMNDLTGGVQVKDMSGRIEGRGLAGRVNLRVVSGAVSLHECRMTALDLSVTSGNIEVETSLAEPDEGDYKINTTSGHIRLRLPEEVKASLECRTLSGRIRLPLNARPTELRNRPGQNQARLELNGGGRRVNINTISGNVEILVGNQESTGGTSWYPAPPPPPAPPVPPVPPMPQAWPQPPMPPVPPMPQAWPQPPVAGEPPAPRPAPVVTPQSRPTEQPEATAPISVGPSSTPVNETSSSEPAPATAAPAEADRHPEPAPAQDRQSYQLQILQAVERGEISIEDALTKLNSLDN